MKSENCVTQNAKLFINRLLSVLIHVRKERATWPRRKKTQIQVKENYSKVFSSIFMIVELILLHAVN